mmetsp:Transcript_973/g.1543  ORF Transcript_973/g.1543 Transcript_973/m.1543 type:complete len:88 (+) Transcript_973:2443-2706(+)
MTAKKVHRMKTRRPDWQRKLHGSAVRRRGEEEKSNVQRVARMLSLKETDRLISEKNFSGGCETKHEESLMSAAKTSQHRGRNIILII